MAAPVLEIIDISSYIGFRLVESMGFSKEIPRLLWGWKFHCYFYRPVLNSYIFTLDFFFSRLPAQFMTT
jgi:hypothetical protein